ncbi:hypothetical protein ALC62_01690, partial [Cyphomyrmex costatus]
VSGVVARQVEPGIGAPLATTVDDGDGQQRRTSSGTSAAVGEWNSLPVLVERLREALELSLAAGCRRGSDEPTATSHGVPGVNVGIGDRSCARRSMEQVLLGSDHDVLPVSRKDELKFLEDLLLSDIQTALSRLRETLERTDIATLTKYGGVSDPTSKLHLLRLVSSLLSRLQVPAEEKESSSSESDSKTIVRQGGNGGALPGRRRRPARHTIGVSTEEIAHARRQLEENSTNLARLNDQVFQIERPEPLLSASRNVTSGERPHVEEIHDKYTKDVINQRQSLRDRNKDTCEYRPSIPPPGGYVDRPAVALRTTDESNTRQIQHRDNVNDYQEKVSDNEETAIKKALEEQSQVTKLAAALRQRAELISASKCNNSSNKFAAKKSKIKRANTIDIPSYLKLQADSLGYDNPGCVVLRRPINVGDKITTNASNLGVPSFHPKTENDKKFLALISRNNEAQTTRNQAQTTYNAAPAFVKSFGCIKATDMSAQANKNWNSRFSNIKTAFDKPSSTNDVDKLSPRLQNITKRFANTPQTSPQNPMNKTMPSIGGTTNNSLSFAKVNVPQSDAGFRHAPSSLFRKIEKPCVPKSPLGHHWQRDNALPPGSSLREKAKMFDRNGNQFQPPPFNVNENTQKSAFPRPPWIEHDRNENKSNKMVTENGRLDYRLFCKQFAPFVGKNTVPEAKCIEDSRRRNEHSNAHRKDLALLNEKFGVVDGKISFRMFPEKGSQLQYRPNQPHHMIEESIRDKSDSHSEKNVFEPLVTVRNDKNSAGTTFAGNAPIDAMFRGSASVAIQTGLDDNSHPEEARVFRVTPKVAKGPPSTYSNVSVQTYNEPEVEAKQHWTTPQYNDAVPASDLSYHSTGDSSHFVLDHNRNYAVTTNIASSNETLPSTNKNTCELVKKDTVCAPYSTEKVPFSATSDHQEQQELNFRTSPRCENYFSPKSAIDNQSPIYPTYIPYVKSNKDLFEDQIPNVSHEIDKENFLCTSDSALPEEQNIQNQDISADTGVVTRYTCAIATVASKDVPKTRVDETRPESGMSSSGISFSSSPSQLWPYPKLTNSETTTTEDEIRRHNLLQQSLVRQLQNERVMLNDYHAPVINQSGNFNQSSFQSNSFNQKLELPKKLETPRRVESSRKLQPPAVVTGLLSVAPSSGFSAKNRITALREQYEQPDGQSRSIQKEHSPIPNGTSSAMDSSDKYLVSCTNRPSRSIVLSKSESWHQLALSKSHQAPSRPVQNNLPPQYLASTGSYLPKPPKPKSPSSFKMRKQYEASSSLDSVKKMEDKIRRYFDNPANDGATETKDSKGRRFSSRDSVKKGLVGLSRSRTMPGICEENLRLTIPVVPQISVASLNSADVDKVFDDIFEEATRTDDHF